MNRRDSQRRLAHHLLDSHHHPRSLKEYLACPSSNHTQSPQASPAHSPSSPTLHLSPTPTPTVEIEVDIGDGRSEVISVSEATDIREEAHRFCEKYGLEANVRELLAESIREKYAQEKQQASLSEFQRERETIREVFANVHAQPVLLSMDDSRPTRYRNEATEPFYPKLPELRYPKDELKTAESRGSKVSGFNSRPKRHSISTTCNKENQFESNHFEINRVSQEICERLGKENILEYRRKRSREKMQLLVREKEKREEQAMRECAFKPKINAISKKVDQQLSCKSREQRKLQRYEMLYQNYKARQGRKEMERARQIMEMPFKPTINLISQKIVESKREREGVDDEKERQRKKAHMSCSQEEFKSLPHTGRHPRNRNLQNLPIGDYLYGQAMKKSKPKPQEPRAEVKANEHSDYLVCILKEKRFNEIFTELTQPPHEELSIAEFNLSHSAFKCGYLRHFMPIFNEMIELDITLARQDFLEASQNLFKVLSPEEKHEIVFHRDKEEKEQPVESRSMVNSKSREILKRSNYEGSNIYDRGLLHRRYIEDKVERDREQKVREELKICTFKPQVSRKG